MNAALPSQSVREQLYKDMSPHNLSPLWEVLHALVPQQPTTPCLPALWRYDAVRPFLMRAGNAISAEEAVRRVLILENPGLRAVQHHAVPVRGLATDPPWRSGPCAPPYPKCPAFHCGRLGRLHSGGWRTHHHDTWGFHHHAQLDLARSRQ